MMRAHKQLLSFLVVIVLGLVCALEVGAQSVSALPFTYLYDTGSPAKASLSGENIASRAGWTRIPEDQTGHAFQGDAVLMNDKLALVLRQEGQGAEVYTRRSAGAQLRATLTPLGTEDAAGPLQLAIVKNAEDGVVIDARHLAAGVRYELLMGQAYVKAEPLEGATRLRVEAPCRFCVLPDFFADDMVIDARRIPIAQADIPSENFLIHMLGDGDALLMNVWDNRDQDVRVNIIGAQSSRMVLSSEIAFGEESSIWVAALEADGIWHKRDIAKEDKGKELLLDWKRPYPALWRVDWHRSDGLTDSWEMLTQQPDGSFYKHAMLQSEDEQQTNENWWGTNARNERPARARWNTGLGWFLFPCWVDDQGTGHLQPLEKKREFAGPALIYPISRITTTPLEQFTVIDVVRATLGVGPCEYILDLEGQKEQKKGIATCAARDILDKIYEEGRQKEERAAVQKALDDVMVFIRLMRGRIHEYEAWGHEIRAYFAEEKAKNPELADFITEMERLAERIDVAIEARREGIKPREFGPGLLEQFRVELVDYEGADAEERCKTITEQLTRIGDNQDELSAECRNAVKALRQRAALAMTTEPDATDIVTEVRARTQAILRNPTNYEAARH